LVGLIARPVVPEHEGGACPANHMHRS
jgi:hypothetical protein